jgi:hypothetical protein
MMLEQEREDIANANGKYKGGKPTARAKVNDARALQRVGVGVGDIAKRLGIARAAPCTGRSLTLEASEPKDTGVPLPSWHLRRRRDAGVT